jgi:hypothetical protein
MPSTEVTTITKAEIEREARRIRSVLLDGPRTKSELYYATQDDRSAGEHYALFYPAFRHARAEGLIERCQYPARDGESQYDFRLLN